jgi:hypothetical protein
MRRRSRYDPLQPVDRSLWLVVRDSLQRVLAATELRPGTDLHAALASTRETLTTAGWEADAGSLKWGFFFCRKAGARLGVTLETCDPGGRDAPPKEWPARNP